MFEDNPEARNLALRRIAKADQDAAHFERLRLRVLDLIDDSPQGPAEGRYSDEEGGRLLDLLDYLDEQNEPYRSLQGIAEMVTKYDRDLDREAWGRDWKP